GVDIDGDGDVGEELALLQRLESMSGGRIHELVLESKKQKTVEVGAGARRAFSMDLLRQMGRSGDGNNFVFARFLTSPRADEFASHLRGAASICAIPFSRVACDARPSSLGELRASEHTRASRATRLNG